MLSWRDVPKHKNLVREVMDSNVINSRGKRDGL